MAAGATTTIDLTAPAQAAVPAGPPPAEPDGDRRHGRLVLAYVVGGAGAVTGGVALGLGLSARSSYNSQFSNGNCSHTSSSPLCNPAGAKAQNDAISRANIATVVGVVGVAAIGAGAVLYLTAPRDRMVVTPAASPGAAGLIVTGAF